MSLAASPIRFPDVASAHGHDPPRVVARRAQLPDPRIRRRCWPATAGSAGSGSARRSRSGRSPSSRSWSGCSGPPCCSPCSRRHRRSGSSPRCSRSTPCSGSSSRSTRCVSCALVKTAPSARGVDRRAHRRSCCVVLSGTAAYGAYLATTASGFLSSVFVAGPTEPPVDGRYNILLLGGDAGPDREGLRPDSISVVSDRRRDRPGGHDRPAARPRVRAVPRRTRRSPRSTPRATAPSTAARSTSASSTRSTPRSS